MPDDRIVERRAVARLSLDGRNQPFIGRLLHDVISNVARPVPLTDSAPTLVDPAQSDRLTAVGVEPQTSPTVLARERRTRIESPVAGTKDRSRSKWSVDPTTEFSRECAEADIHAATRWDS
jgi:hypothetical protein